MVKISQCRKVARLRHHQFADARCLGVAYALPPCIHGKLQHFRRRAFKVFYFYQTLVDVVADVFPHHRLKQLLFAFEVQKQRAFGHPSLGGHFFRTRGGKTFGNKQIQRSVQQFTRTRFFAPRVFDASVVHWAIGVANDVFDGHVNCENLGVSHDARLI